MLTMLTRTVGLIIIGFLVANLPAGAEVVSVGSITVYGPDEVLCYVSERGGEASLAFPGAPRWVLEGEPDDYFPMSTEEVVSALEAIEFPVEVMTVHVVILPVPRRSLPKSSAEGNIVFLCPGRVQYQPEHIHYTVTHEIGHIVQHVLMPDSRHDLWDEYIRLRGLEEHSALDPTCHASSLHEIFAEDFRVLFGGERARCGGEVENHYIGSPSDIEGLAAFILSLPHEGRRASGPAAYPNPFEINMVLSTVSLEDAEGIQQVDIYDVEGRIVRSIRTQDGRSVEVVWDGMTSGGTPAAPGLYLIKATTARKVYVSKVTKISR